MTFFSIRSRRSQVYPLMFGSQKIPVYCHMENFGCGGGGWTLAMKINGAKEKSLPSKNPLILLKLKKKRKKKETKNWKLSSLSFREPSITILTSGATEMSIILLEVRLALTRRRPNYQPTGIHPSPRSNTCGNEATYSPDNGNKHIKAMGYILVQWQGTQLTSQILSREAIMM